MAGFGRSFLNETSTRLSNLLKLEGQVSPRADGIESLVSVLLVGDATDTGYGQSRRQYANYLPGGASFRCWQARVDTIVTRVRAVNTNVAVAAAGFLRLQYYPPELAQAGFTSGGVIYDGGRQGELSDLDTGTVGAATGTTMAVDWFILGAPIGTVVMDLTFGTTGFFLKQGARICLDASAAITLEYQVFGRTY